MNQTKNPTALQSQKWILQALLDLMLEYDYDKISVSEICRKAMLDRRTFYRNFDSKQDLLDHYIGQLRRQYLIEFRKVDQRDRYSASLLFFQFWKRHLKFIKNLQTCGLSAYVFDQFKKFSISQKEFMIDGQGENDKMNYILAFRIGGYWNLMLAWAENGARATPEELAAVIAQI